MPRNAYAAFEDKPLAARPAAMSGAYTALANDYSAPFFNPAGLNLLSAAALSFSQTSLYGESDLKHDNAGFMIPTRSAGSFAFNYTSFGAAFYKESELVFTHSLMLVPGAYFGYNIRNLSLKIEGGGSASAVSFDAGALGVVSTKLSLGIFSRGLNRPQIASENLYRDLTGSVCYRPFRGMITVIDWNMPVDREEDIIKLGAEINVIPEFCVRFGVQPEPQSASFGFGLMFNRIDFDYAFRTHEVLDNQHLFSASLRWGEKRESAAPTDYYKKAKKRRRRTVPAVKGEKPVELTDINIAEIADFDALPGIGKVTAVRIVDYRNNNGPFTAKEDLLKVPRFTKRQFNKMKDYIKVEAPSEKPEGLEYVQPVQEEKAAAEKTLSPDEKEKLKKKLYFKGLKLYQAKKYSQAITEFEKILKIDPAHPQSLRIIERCKQKLRR
ncbi:MAG: helix-hairpin-helix domain-containing protein [Elusimicrobiota bacterium]|nr:helix-hairpin-helix domain-containing protein [Elusimicrobiota bacterium]